MNVINTFTTCSVGSQTDLAFLLEYVKSLQAHTQRTMTVSHCQTHGMEKWSVHEMSLIIIHSFSTRLDHLLIPGQTEEPDEQLVVKGDDRDRSIISPSTLSVPQKVRLFEEFTKDTRMTSSATAPAQLYTPQAYSV